MAFERPSLRALITQLQTDAEREAGANPLRASNLRVLPKVFAYACHGLYAYIDYCLRQILPDTAEKSFLERQASIQGIYRKAASKATGTIDVKYSEGALIPIGTVFVASDGETRYATTAEPSAKSGGVPVQCLTPGATGNRDAGDTYTLTSPLAGVQAEAIGAEMAGGADEESDDDLRARLLYRLQNPPRGGTKSDYVAWALEVPGVTRAWCFPKAMGLGTVVVRFMTDSLTENGVPTPGMVTQVSDYIAENAPVTAATTVLAPIAKPVDVTIKELLPDTASVRAQIEAELRALLIRECVPGQKIYLSHIRQAISTATGEEDFELVSPVDDVPCQAHEVLILGEVTYE